MNPADPYSRLQYRRLIAWPKRIEREWPFLEKVLTTAPSRRLLDLGCGTGEHARYLVEKGFDVVGVDRSEAQLETAREEAMPDGLRFVHGELPELASLVEGAFGAAICLGNTLPHLTTAEQLDGLLCGLRQRLAPGGAAVFQLLSYERIFAQSQRHLPLNFRPDDDDSELVFLRLMQPLPDGMVRFCPTTLRFRPSEDRPVEVLSSRSVMLKGWRCAELEAALAAAGFGDVRLYGAFDGSTFDPAGSADLIVVAR